MKVTPPNKRGRKEGLPTFAERIEAEGGDQAVFREIAAGRTIREVMAAYGYQRDQFYHWISAGDDSRRAAWKEANVVSADALVEQAGEILDDALEITNSARATIAKERAAHRKWLASCRNREAYGDRTAGAQVVLNIGQLHLDALRTRGSMELAKRRIGELRGPVVDAVLVEGD